MIELVRGSILRFKGDAIVNAANGHLQHGGGLARIIENAATGTRNGSWVGHREGFNLNDPEIAQDVDERVGKWRDDHANAPLIATGNAYVTSAGLLPFKGVIHAVGPIWNGGNHLEFTLLCLTMSSVILRCKANRFESVAVPAISCGIFGFPVDKAAFALTTIAKHEHNGLDISFYVMEDSHEEAFKYAMATLGLDAIK